MVIAALLSWFDEDPSALARMVHSLPLLGVDALVAVDGRYASFAPGTPHISDPEQPRAVQLAAGEAGIDCYGYSSEHPWRSEVEKRSFLFAEAEVVTGADWYFVIDADEVVATEYDVKACLAETDLAAAAVTLREPTGDAPLRMFFRAIPGLKVERNHHTYVTPDGRKLWGGHGMEPALDLREVVVEHRRLERSAERSEAARLYYRDRDQTGIEMGACERGCGRVATHELPTNWNLKDDGLLTSEWIAVCDDHLRDVRIENAKRLQSFGLDPAQVRVAFRRPDEVLA